MPPLSNQDKLQIYRRNPKLMADLEELNGTPFDLNRAFSPEAQSRAAVLLERINKVWGHSLLSPDGIGKLLEQLRSRKILDSDLTRAVKVIQHARRVIRPSRPDEPTRIDHLRDGRFLTIEIDLTAALKKDDLLKEIGKCIDNFPVKQVEGPRPRKLKRHKATNDIDMWEVYDRWEGGENPYQIALQLYRKREGNVAGFGTHTKEYKVVQRKLKATQSMINNFQYPPQ